MSTQLQQKAQDQQTRMESMSPDISLDLKKEANALVGSTSLLDGIQEPIDMEAVNEVLLRRMLQDMRGILDQLGFAYVSGGRGPGDLDYIYVPTGQSGGDGFNLVKSGPGFTPYMDGAGGDYRPNDRTTVIFENVNLQFSDVVYGIPRVTNEKIDTLAQFEIDNARGPNDIRSELALEYFDQGTVEAAVARNWQNSINWDFRTEQTINLGFGVEGAMFPRGTISFSESVGGNNSKGGSANRSQTLQQAQRQTFRHEVTTSRFSRETYVASASSSSCVIPFSAKATLGCSCKVHGFLRWGGGERFKGKTNYHLTWSGQRQDLDYCFGGPRQTWWEAMRLQQTKNLSPWNWARMNENYGSWAAEQIARISAPEWIAKNYSFEVNGVIAGVKRRNIGFAVTDSKVVIDPDDSDE